MYYLVFFLIATLALHCSQKTSLDENNENVFEKQENFVSDFSNKEPLILNLKGIFLVGLDTGVLSKDSSAIIDGIQWINLDIPGNASLMRKKLLSFLNAPITTKTIQRIKQTITDHYISNNFPFILVAAPEQEITSGVLQFTILESKLGQVIVEGNRWTSTKRLKQYIRVQPDQRIDQSRLIRNVSFINRHPFHRVDLVFTRGEKEGTTDVILATKDRRPIRIYGGTDNTGVDPTGAKRWYTGFNWGNAFGLDHILSYQFTTSYEMHLFKAHTAEYTALLSWGDILNIYGGYSEVHPHVNASVRRNDGWSLQTSARYVIPLKIYAYLDHEITIGGDFKRSNNTFEYTEDFPRFGNNVNLTQVILGYSGNYERNTFRVDFDSELFWSPGKWLADQTNTNFSSLRPGAVNQWVYFRGALTYLQRLPKSFSLSLRAVGQVASQPLLPSEQFGIGGYDTVRGYEQRELNKDDAVLLNMELRTPALPTTRWLKSSSKVSDGLQFLTFLDYGWGTNINTIPGTEKSDYLLGVGPGVRYTLEPYVTARLDWGVRLHNKESFEGTWNKIHFSATASF